MKYLKQNLIVLMLTISTTSMMNSCSSYILNEDQLSSFMLGGIYFIEGYGGMDELVEILVVEENLTDNGELIEGYRLYLEFPFDHTQKSDCASYLVDFWDIQDKTDLVAQMEELKSREYDHKAWDYARLVNIAAQGYAAQYLNEEEVLKVLGEILPLAREKYDTWENYYQGYNAGLKDWDPESEQIASTAKLTRDLLSNKKSIYTIIPLNP